MTPYRLKSSHPFKESVWCNAPFFCVSMDKTQFEIDANAFLAFRESLHAGEKKRPNRRRSLAQRQQAIQSRVTNDESILSSHTKWNEKRHLYTTTVNIRGRTITTLTFQYEDTVLADTYASNVSRHNSIIAKRQRRTIRMRNRAHDRVQAENMQRFRDNGAMERDFAHKFIAAWKKKTGFDALVCNDGTRADILLGFSADADLFLEVQLKTTDSVRNYGQAWEFKDVTGYSGMPVICWRYANEDAWIFDGTVLNDRGIKDIKITMKYKNDKLALARQLGVQDLIDFLLANASKWQMRTEYDARHDFKSVEHAKEMRAIDAYRAVFKESVFHWPYCQGSHIDQLENGKRQQFKMIRPSPNSAGFMCNTYTYDGRSDAGVKLYSPYPRDAFDELVAVYFDGDVPHFWKFPAELLYEKGILSGNGETEGGRVILTIHPPDNVKVRERVADKNANVKANTWTSEYYIHMSAATINSEFRNQTNGDEEENGAKTNIEMLLPEGDLKSL